MKDVDDDGFIYRRPEWTEGISKQLVLIGDKPVLFCLGPVRRVWRSGSGSIQPQRVEMIGENTRFALHLPRWCADL